MACLMAFVFQTHAQVPFCQEGIRKGQTCCAKTCGLGAGACGGNKDGCKDLPGGKDACCGPTIRKAGRVCASSTDTICIQAPPPTSPTTSAPPPPAQLCCKAMIASCLSCSAGQTVEEYCVANPKTQGCPKPKPSPSPSPLGFCQEGIRKGQTCCAKTCGTGPGACGGNKDGCKGLPGGEDACCGPTIRKAGRVCTSSTDTICVQAPPPTSPTTSAPPPPTSPSP